MIDYYTSIYTSRNTCIDGRTVKKNYNSAGNYAKRLSKTKKVYKVIIRSGDWFEEYKDGKKISWSV